MHDNTTPKTSAENISEAFTKAMNTKPAALLQNYFDTLKKGAATQNEETLSTGVKMFSDLVNSPIEEREVKYGNRWSGFHFPTDLAESWNKNHSSKVTRSSIIFGAPTGWKSDHHNGHKFLLYVGEKPLSEGLNNLMKGPTVIDCSIFCQLSIWMGMRYYLSDETFDALFGKTPFYITALLYEPYTPQQPALGNPLLTFFDRYTQKDFPSKNNLAIQYIANIPEYSLKHPGGTSPGENIITTKNHYTLFGPQARKTRFSDIKEIEEFLRQKYNEAQNSHDQDMLQAFSAEPNTLHIRSNRYFGDLFKLSEQYKYHQVNENEWQNTQNQRALEEAQIVFNYARFENWLNEARVEHTQSNTLELRNTTSTSGP